jgi:multiple antibiotic resistance protein
VAEWVMPYVENFLLAFVPIFFAVDAFGVLPLFMGLTEGIEHGQRQRVVKEALITALLVGIGFVFLGKAVFGLMGITVSDFMVAGGALLFVIATLDLLSGEKTARRSVEAIGAVPLGTPLIIGPATLTMSLILVDLYGLAATLAAIVVNIAIAGMVFLTADFFTRILGKAGSRAASKVASLLLAAIAVMMMRRGVLELISTVTKGAYGQ